MLLIIPNLSEEDLMTHRREASPPKARPYSLGVKLKQPRVRTTQFETTLKAETYACRKDIRRLGWEGLTTRSSQQDDHGGSCFLLL